MQKKNKTKHTSVSLKSANDLKVFEIEFKKQTNKIILTHFNP